MVCQRWTGVLKLWLAFCLIIVIVTVGTEVLAEEQQAPAEGHLLFESRNDSAYAALVDSLLGVAPKPLITPIVKSFEPDGELAEPWRGNAPQLTAMVPEVSVAFNLVTAPGSEQEGQQAFEIFLTIEKDALIFRHSSPKEQRFLGGIRVSLREKQLRNFYLEGAKGSGVAVIASQQFSTNPLMLLLCPRTLASRKPSSGNSAKQTLVPSGVEMQAAQFKVAGSVRGKVLTGVGMGKGRAEILTSPNIFRSVEFEDEVYSKDPTLDLDYRPFHEDKISASVGSEELIGGIKVSLLGHKPAGFKRVSTLREGVWLKRVALERPASLVISRAEVSVEPGVCVFLFKEQDETVVYSKEPLT